MQVARSMRSMHQRRWTDASRVAALVGATAVAAALLDLATLRSATALPALLALALLVAALAAGALVAGRRATALRAEVVHLRAAQEDVRRDAASIAHDLRSPLTTVCSYLDLLAAGSFGPISSEARVAAQRAGLATARVRALVDGVLLQHARAAAARPLTPGAVDLRALLRDVTDSLAAEIVGTGAEVTVEPLPLVSGDPQALFRVFSNLVENAVKYARPGEAPCVTITGHAAAGRLEIAVHDRGVGIPAEERERVFAPEARAANARAIAPGHGLGLATVRRLVHALGGEAWIDPAVMDGATVRLSLPLAEG